MGDIKNGAMNDVVDSISDNLKGYAEDVYGDYAAGNEIKNVIDEIQGNLEKTKYTVDEQEYEDKIRKIAAKLNNKNKTIEDSTSFDEVISDVKKDVFKGYEYLKDEKSTSSKKNKTNEKKEKNNINRLMPTRIRKRTTLKQKIALILRGGLIAKIPFVKEFIDEQLKPLNSGKTKMVSSKGTRSKMLESLGFKGVSHSKAKAGAQKAKTRTAQQSQGR